jgi:hypothetical protein
MPYYVTNNKPRLIMGFVPGVAIISDERYDELYGKSDAKVKDLKSPQSFFREQIKIKHLTVVKCKTKNVGSDDPSEVVAGMNINDAVKFCIDCGDPRVLSTITKSEKRAKVLSAAKNRLAELTDNADNEEEDE